MEEKTTLKNGQQLLIRSAVPEDAKAIIDFINIVSTESDFLAIGEGDFKMTEARERLFLADLNKSSNKVMVLGLIDDDIVSVSDVQGGNRSRIQHYTELSVSVKKSYWNIGIGQAMTEFLLNWARKTNVIRKINLQVRVSNKWAIHLYELLGFKIEGKITRGICINDVFYDLFMMGLEID